MVYGTQGRRIGVFALDRADDGGDAVNDALVIVSLAKGRGNDQVDNAAGEEIGQPAFETVAHFDAYLALFFGNEQENPVVLAFLADFPGIDNLDAVGLDRLSLQGIDGQHGDLGGIRPIKIGKGLFQFYPGGRA